MAKDFYLDERALAAYLEKDWFDHILRSDPYKPEFAYAPFDASLLYSDYHERLVQFLKTAIADTQPRTMLEVGSALGRTFYEICKSVKSVKTATLLEPSQNLFAMFAQIFDGNDIAKLSILRGNLETAKISLDTRPIRAACSAVAQSRLNIPFQQVQQDLGQFDLVICANVIDQCRNHLQLAEFLKASTAPGGVVLLSCTYQWSEKYVGNASEVTKDINDLFRGDWRFLAETNLPFHVRVYERYWMTFLSHAVAYQRLR